MRDQENLLNGKGLSKRYGDTVVLRDVSLRVAPGSITALIGPNGAGKSTLFDLLSGFVPADSGSVHYDHQDVTRLKAFRRARLGLVKTFQIPHEFHGMSVLDNLLVAAPGQVGEHFPQMLWKWRAIRAEQLELIRRAEAILDFLGLSNERYRPAGLLSGGQKKLLELARALMLDPKLLLLDEPFAGVRHGLVQQIMERLLALKQRGVTQLIVEHNLQAVMSMADVVYVLVEGEMLASGDPSMVQTDRRVLEAYLGGAL